MTDDEVRKAVEEQEAKEAERKRKQRDYNKKYREANKEALNKQDLERFHRNKERYGQRHKEYYQANLEKCRELGRLCKQKHKAKYKAKRLADDKAFREQVAAQIGLDLTDKINSKAAREMLKLPLATFYRYVNRGLIPSHRTPAGKRYFLRSEISRLGETNG